MVITVRSLDIELLLANSNSYNSHTLPARALTFRGVLSTMRPLALLGVMLLGAARARSPLPTWQRPDSRSADEPFLVPSVRFELTLHGF